MGDLNLPQFSSHPSCIRCELHQGARNPGIATIHYEQSLFPSKEITPLIIVGMNPGVEEDKTNRPFEGPSGKLLKNVYLHHEDFLKTTTIYITNAARCRSDSPKRSHFRHCWTHLEKDIQEIIDYHTPKAHLLCLGGMSYDSISKQLLGRGKPLKHAFNNQGEVATQIFPNKLHIYATFHPAAVLRKRNYLYPVSDHLNLLGNMIMGRIPQVSRPKINKPRSPHART